MATILIIEDTAEAATIIKLMLQRQNHTVYIAENGEKGLAMVHDVSPDLIIMDVMMPGLSGFEVCEQLKADETTAHIPVIFSTVSSQQKHMDRAFELGAADYILKPFNYQIFQERINVLIT